MEIERMSQEFVLDTKEREDEKVPSYQSLEHQGFLHSETAMAPLEAFRQLQSYLVMDKSVVLPTEDGNGNAEVTITVHNTAPSSIGGPSIRFSLVVVTYLKAETRSLREIIEGNDDVFRDIRDLVHDMGRETEGALHLGALRPGEVGKATFSLPLKKLLEVELDVLGIIDPNRLLTFHRATGLPSEVLSPIQQEFLGRLEAISVREFVNKALEHISTLDSNITLSQIATVREEIKTYSSKSAEKRNDLAELTREYALSRESMVGSRLRETILTLAEFEQKLTVLDEAIGQTDLELIMEAAQNLKQVQLALIRLEDALKTVVERD